MLKLLRRIPLGRMTQTCRLSCTPDILNAPIRQGGRLVIDLRDAGCGGHEFGIHVRTGWQEHVDVFEIDSRYLEVTVHEKEQYMLVRALEAMHTASSIIPLTVGIPEKFNLELRAHDDSVINLDVHNKLEGDLRVSCSHGKVNLEKVRGVNIEAHCGNASLESKSLIEGLTVNLSAATLRAKKLNGDTVRIHTQRSINVGSMYCQGGTAVISTTGMKSNLTGSTGDNDINLGLMNGHLKLHSVAGDVNVSNIDGWFDIEAEKGVVTLQVNQCERKLVGDRAGGGMDEIEQKDSVGCRAVSLDGNLMVNISPQIQASMTALCTNPASRGVITVVSDNYEAIAELGGSERYTFGRFHGGADASVPTGSGKIELNASKMMQSLVSKEKGAIPSTCAVDSIDKERQLEMEQGSPDLELEAHGHLRIETVSWIELIKRKHGFENESSKGPPTKAGRAATSKDLAHTLVK